MRIKPTGVWAGILLALVAVPRAAPAHPERDSTSPRLSESTIMERESPANQHSIVVGLGLRNRDELERFLAEVQDPASPNYGQFLTPDEFNARYAPTAE